MVQMTLTEYVDFTSRTWINKTADISNEAAHAKCGLVAKVGKLNAIDQKYARGDFVDVSVDDLLAMAKKELGNILYYWVRTCVVYGFTPQEILNAHVEKLQKRLERATILGFGDAR